MFICVHRLDRGPLTPDDVTPFRRRFADVCKGTVTTHTVGSFAAMVSDNGVRSSVVRHRGCIGVGSIRLDNRDEIAAWGEPADAQSDLGVMMAGLEQRGEGAVSRVLGDFAVVLWNPFNGQLCAARDALGVRTLYVRQHASIVAFASWASLLGQEEAYDQEYIADFLVNGDPRSTHTIWRGVHAVPPGTTMTVRGASVVARTYWSPDTISTSATGGN